MNSRFIRHAAIARSVRMMRRFGRNRIDVVALANAVSMSRRGFLKAFLQHTGRHPGAEIRRRRLEYSRRLLSRTRLGLREIATASGYASANCLCIAFKRDFGLTPSQYRQTHRKTPPSRLESFTLGRKFKELCTKSRMRRRPAMLR